MTWRVRGRDAFYAFERTGHRARAGPVVVTWVPPSATEPPRVAYAVGRRTGGAVARNHLRRRLRAVVRDLGPLVPGSYLVGAGKGAMSLSYGELKTSVSKAMRAAARSGR